ncbi:hypothetical protein PIB30_102528, partial [Stylosanthes scabra]|nr:hypothetical protein [Stylosanthes scabra]
MKLRQGMSELDGAWWSSLRKWTLLESTLHCTESTLRALFGTEMSFEALRVDYGNLRVDSK